MVGIRLVVLKSRLGLESGLESSFGGLGLGLASWGLGLACQGLGLGLGFGRLKNQVLYQVHTQTDGNGLFSKWRSHFLSYWISMAKNRPVDRCNRKYTSWLKQTDICAAIVPTKAHIPLGLSRRVSTRLDTFDASSDVELIVSSHAVRQARHRQNAWTLHVANVYSCRVKTRRTKCNLGLNNEYCWVFNNVVCSRLCYWDYKLAFFIKFVTCTNI